MASYLDQLPPQAKVVVDKVQHYVAQVDRELEKYPALVKFEQTTNCSKAWSTIGLLTLVATSIFFNIIAPNFFINVLGVGIPAYISLNALQTPDTKDDVQWLTYWVSFGFLTILESFSSIFLHYCSYYYTIKALVLVWLMQFGGAKVVYVNFLQPIFRSKQPVAPAAAAAATAADPAPGTPLDAKAE